MSKFNKGDKVKVYCNGIMIDGKQRRGWYSATVRFDEQKPGSLRFVGVTLRDGLAIDSCNPQCVKHA